MVRGRGSVPSLPSRRESAYEKAIISLPYLVRGGMVAGVAAGVRVRVRVGVGAGEGLG